jgi:hypothetical protein
MMSDYTPKPGDRVTSPLLVGEWEVNYLNDHNKDGREVSLIRHNATAWVPLAGLTPVTPPLPPEPAVGSVVRAHGQLWQRNGAYWYDGKVGEEAWADLATADDLSPVVAVDDVAEWLENNVDFTDPGPGKAQQFRAAFGGWDK